MDHDEMKALARLFGVKPGSREKMLTQLYALPGAEGQAKRPLGPAKPRAQPRAGAARALDLGEAAFPALPARSPPTASPPTGRASRY